MGEELGIPTEAINPFASSTNFLTMAPWPDSVSEQSSFAPAMGMALSNNHITPNFLYTYKDKEKAMRGQRISRGVLSAFFLVIAICVGLAFWQDLQIKDKESQRDFLEQKLASFNLRVDENLILRLLEQHKAKNLAILELSKTYLDLAVVGEITNLTPANIRLMSIVTDLGSLTSGKDETPNPKNLQNSNRIIVLDGIIQGERLNLESNLAGSLMALDNSPLFDQPSINRKSFEIYEKSEVLHFTAQLILS